MLHIRWSRSVRVQAYCAASRFISRRLGLASKAGSRRCGSVAGYHELTKPVLLIWQGKQYTYIYLHSKNKMLSDPNNKPRKKPYKQTV